MKKTFLLVMSITFSLFTFASCSNNSSSSSSSNKINQTSNLDTKASYKLDIVDYYDLLFNDLNNEYKAGSIVEIVLKDKNGTRNQIFFNGEYVAPEGKDELNNTIYKITMPENDSTLTISPGEVIEEGCDGNHVWNDGEVVSVPGNGKETLYTCITCGKTTTVIIPIENRYKDSLEIGHFGNELITVDSENNHFDLELGWSYSLYLSIKDDRVDMDNLFYQNVKLDFNKDTSNVIYKDSNGYANYVRFSLYPLKKSTNNQIEVSYKDFKYQFTYDIVDFDYSKHSAKKPTLEEINQNLEFKKLIDSIKYYQFEEPYLGLDSYSSSVNYGFTYNYDFKIQNDEYIYDTNYLSALTDSVYYPTYFPMVNDNPIAFREMEMIFDDNKKVMEGVSSSIMTRFSLIYGVIDPCCTSPKSNLYNVDYTAVPLNYLSEKTSLNTYNCHFLNSGYYFLSENNPDNFYNYQINGLNIKIISIYNNDILALFNDGNYAYSIGFSYAD